MIQWVFILPTTLTVFPPPAMPPTSRSSTPTPAGRFEFYTCQPGAEAALKQELAAARPALRFAFSRPGFLSFKTDETGNFVPGPLGVFARTRSAFLARIEANQLSEGVAAVWQLPEIEQLAGQHPLGGLHVWQRDTQLPGEGGLEPHVTPLAREVRAALVAARDELGFRDALRFGPGDVAQAGDVVLDVVLVEPNQWWIGWHRAESRVERWPGGMLPVAMPEDAVSRAYLKMEEALKWGSLPTTKGEVWAELGCAPGGSSQALLDRGFHVIGIDPAEVDPEVAEHPRFLHVRKRTVDVRRSEFAPAKWLASDLNVAPQFTLDAVEEIVKHPSTNIRGMVLTLKLADWSLAAPEQLDAYVQRVQGWGYRDVRLRQLVHNRREICLIALPSRAQRRVTRSRRRGARPRPAGPGDSPHQSSDSPHAGLPPHHFR